MNEDSKLTPYLNRRSVIGTVSRGIVLVVYFFVLTCIISRTFAATSPRVTPCPIRPKTTEASTVIVPPDRMTSLLYNLRGGSEKRNKTRNGQNLRGKLKTMRVLNKKQASEVTRRFLKLGPKGWKYAVEQVAFNTKNSSITTTSTEKNPRGKASNDKYLNQKASKDGDDHIEIRKPSQEAPRLTHYSPFKMYTACMGIVSLWILTGTFFYSYTNEWPVPQSFFYAVDAGMSIGFCTDVAETKLVSKAFTIVYIIMGASVVGGALALFIQDIVEGVVDGERKNNIIVLTKEFELLLGKKAFERLDVSHSGSLSKNEFGKLLKAISNKSPSSPTTKQLSDEDIDVLWTKFDRVEDGVIRFEEFEGTYRGIEGLLDSLLPTNTTATCSTYSENQEIKQATPKIQSIISSLASSVSSFARPLLTSENRIYFVFLAWVLLGIVWGMLDQDWDPITATHFAISALATGGLTAPPVNSDGILPAEPAIFCGFYCLFGIPLMAITFGHFARVLVSDHVAAMERWALTRPITATDYEIAKQYLIHFRGTRTEYSHHRVKSILGRGRQQHEHPSSSPSWRGLRLSDFIVLQIFRQGRISVEAINILKKEFDLLDTDKTGLLTLEEATNWCTSSGEHLQE